MHRDVYPAVDPSNPSLSAQGKTILINGAAGTLGQAVAEAWATASASCIILTGRTLSTLTSVSHTLSSISPSTNVVRTVDTKDAAQQNIVVTTIVDAAGALTEAVTGTIPPAQWFDDFVADVLAPYHLAHYMMTAYGDAAGTFIVLGSLAAGVVLPGLSSYSAAKLSGECEECDDDGVSFAVCEGYGGVDGGVWTLFLSTERAEFLKGGILNVNWDVEEMEQHKEEIVGKGLLQLAFVKAQLSPAGHPFESKA
ncbi:hypothetical protein EJ04DRAFT_547944 [Polyplosphaeria fusca]|uniref:NAD(P)-binding protein n=1 Tax=Polyplosphaeria fusca TaxID=682080 RepID=A0A9P4RA61_9PLEO|nr:hypothetical protein EJ04DRAFT_547944 [Polyplosphaeria fusca]